MVPHPRAPLGARDLRPLNAPAPIEVTTDARGEPRLVRRRGREYAVARVQDRWRVDDEWWRERPIARLYYTLLLADATLLTLYHDLIGNTWHEQRD